ncbi:DUF305 domain-containing protein [Streptomyces sp. NPDC050508]|uniref:DUF305 domain-containing protein n=1 Tax=Streptomyces sp. NPDC050508 TaxID=3155405 RepID=UPI003414680A
MRNTRTLTRRATLTATALTAALILTACGNGSDSASSGDGSSSASADATAGAHNAQDVSFAQGMIPHHQQALEMAKLATDRASSAEVKDLAARIEKAQDPEIQTMNGWLKSWGVDMSSSMSGMDDSAHSDMPGMMDSTHMDMLKKASGTDFDTMFLTMMIEHHKGAVNMATTEKNKGKYGSATAMADDIITAQTGEITEMNKLLGKN